MQKKIMWVIESDLTIKEIVAMVDEVKNEILCYAYKDEFDSTECKPDWMNTYDDEQYFDTECQAVEARNQFIREAKDMMPRVRKFVNRMYDIKEDNEFLSHKREDFLGCFALDPEDEHYYRKRLSFEQSVNKSLVMAFKSGLLNINAETIRIDDVVRIEWGKYEDVDKDGNKITGETATLVLHDDKKLRTRSRVEYCLVEYIFGENGSNRIFNVPKLKD